MFTIVSDLCPSICFAICDTGQLYFLNTWTRLLLGSSLIHFIYSVKLLFVCAFRNFFLSVRKLNGQLCQTTCHQLAKLCPWILMLWPLNVRILSPKTLFICLQYNHSISLEIVGKKYSCCDIFHHHCARVELYQVVLL